MTIETTTPVTTSTGHVEAERYGIPGLLRNNGTEWHPLRHYADRRHGATLVNVCAESDEYVVTRALYWEADPARFYAESSIPGGLAEAVTELAYAEHAVRAGHVPAPTADPADALRARVAELEAELASANKSRGIDPAHVKFWAEAMDAADNLNLCGVFERVSMGIGGPTRGNQIKADSPEAAGFWERAEELARDHDVLADYNRLAEELGGPTVQLARPGVVAYAVTLTVQVHVEDLDDYEVGEYDLASAIYDMDRRVIQDSITDYTYSDEMADED